VTPPGLRIRQGRLADATELAELMARTFRDAFGAMNRPEDLAAHLARSYGTPAQQRELSDSSVTTLLAEIAGELCGYAQLRDGPERPASVTGPAPLQLWRFYLDQAWIGRGVAQPLMEAATQAARARGARTLWLSVWEHNPRGIAFYRKAGFEAVGTVVFHVGDDPQTDLVMVHSLALE
jgi:ribosomal protein S18 acetylase RimI-like enzyme